MVYRLTECVTHGLHIIESRGVKVIETLPKQSETWLYNQMKPDSELAKEEQERLWSNDHRIDNFEQRYFSYLSAIGVKAADSKSVEIARSTTWSINSIISSVVQHVDGHEMKAMIVRRGIWSLDELTKASLSNQLSDSMTLSMLKFAAEYIDSDRDEAVAWYIVNYVSEFLIDYAKQGLLDYMNIIDSAMVGLGIVAKYTEPTIRLLESFSEAAKLLKNNNKYGEDKGLQLSYNEIIRRIIQVGQEGRAKEPKKMSPVVKSILQSLGEQEFDKNRGD